MTGWKLILFLAIWTSLSVGLCLCVRSYLERSLKLGRIGNFLEGWVVQETEPKKFAAAVIFYRVFIAMAAAFAIFGLTIAAWQIWKLQ